MKSNSTTGREADRLSIHEGLHDVDPLVVRSRRMLRERDPLARVGGSAWVQREARELKVFGAKPRAFTK